MVRTLTCGGSATPSQGVTQLKFNTKKSIWALENKVENQPLFSLEHTHLHDGLQELQASDVLRAHCARLSVSIVLQERALLRKPHHGLECARRSTEQELFALTDLLSPFPLRSKIFGGLQLYSGVVAVVDADPLEWNESNNPFMILTFHFSRSTSQTD